MLQLSLDYALKGILDLVQGVLIELMGDLWKTHWLWSRVVAKDVSKDHASEVGTLVASKDDLASSPAGAT